MNMSEENEVVTSCCASCGVAEIDNVKLLKQCDGCDLVKYCSDECREIHKSEHEEASRETSAELRDKLLFKQPENNNRGDCPICCLPLPLDHQKSSMYSCCSKVICVGCDYANEIREMEMELAPSCPFCRAPLPKTKEEYDKQNMKRVEMNDPVALCHEGFDQSENGDYRNAFEYWTKAAELGDAEAHYNLAVLYHNRKGVENDEGKYVHHLEEAAIGGHPSARYVLGCHEYRLDNFERAVKHYIIAANQGQDGSIKALMKLYKEGLVSKEDLANTLRAHQVAVNATKSSQRKEAEEYD